MGFLCETRLFIITKILPDKYEYYIHMWQRCHDRQPKIYLQTNIRQLTSEIRVLKGI